MGIPEKLASLPHKPGIYRFLDARGRLLYIGKAKNLAHRVRSYFQSGRFLEPSKEWMVKKVVDLDTTIVASETEALLLESSLIQRFKPPYNVNLKDDKSFLYLKVTTRDPYPTVEAVRRLHDPRARYFGPYTSAFAVRQTVKLLKRVFQFRTCKPNQGRPCFDYPMHRCVGVCIGAVTPQEYRRQVVEPILRFLAGDRETIVADLGREMKVAARQKRFERAAIIRDQLRAVEKLTFGQAVISPRRESEDLVSFVQDDHHAAFNVFAVRFGKLLDRQTMLVGNALGLPPSELLASFLRQYYPQVPNRPKRVFVSIIPEEAHLIERALGLRIRKGERGRRRRLLDLGAVNARAALEREKRAWANDAERAYRAIETLKNAMRLPTLPKRIEAYDISNIQGTNPVGSMVVFVKGLPAKDAYRKFSIKTVRGSNDPAMMAEVLRRRLIRLSEDPRSWPKPDLILLDGGITQLNAVVPLLGKTAIPIAALAKREEELYLPGRAKPLRLPRDSEALFLLERIRDEAHRFAVGYHRLRRGKEAIHSALDDITGIGPATKKRLLEAFGSVRGVREASIEELERVIGKVQAEKVKEKL